MASGMQTIANLGVHQTPYYVDYIDDAAGNRVYTHTSTGERVLDTRVALTADLDHEGRAHARAPRATS